MQFKWNSFCVHDHKKVTPSWTMQHFFFFTPALISSYSVYLCRSGQKSTDNEVIHFTYNIQTQLLTEVSVLSLQGLVFSFFGLSVNNIIKSKVYLHIYKHFADFFCCDLESWPDLTVVGTAAQTLISTEIFLLFFLYPHTVCHFLLPTIITAWLLLGNLLLTNW